LIAAIATVLVAMWVGVGSVHAQATSQEVRLRSFDLIYNLDRDRALELLQGALEKWPSDAALHRSVALMAWLEILFQRGSVTMDDYLGTLTRQNVENLPPPAPALATLFEVHAQRAVDLARERLKKEPRSVDALYELGVAEGLLASYKATVRGKVLESLGDARRAYNAHELTLEIDPRRKDAALIVGIYRYVIGSLALPLRLMAYVVGFGGDKQRGIRMVEEAAAFTSDAQAEAQFALTLLYNRERRFDEALNVLERLRKRFPRNRFLWLEGGATALRAGRADAANRLLAEGMSLLAADRRPRARGEEPLWRHKRGTALARLGRAAEAATELRAALTGEGRDWVRGRSHLELGRLALARGDRAAAQADFERAAALCAKDRDDAFAEEARKLRDQVQP
jgi:tetratricopeptide (TPR) repeat protein